MNNKNIDPIISLIEKSPLWIRLNMAANAMYEKAGRVPSEEEYAALREMLMCKVMLEDEEVHKAMSDSTWEAFQN